ncbi:MAG: 50S ribosomal protein L25 [Desulfovibrio sp.]|uniref:50S ribosomal protein L25 n=1 Tax=Desulfovibrio sp. 7SRBS1 TaxID=3378064 RepID=UPI003B3FE5CB
MAEIPEIKVTPRVETGTGPNNRLRSKGLVPGIYYNKEGENILVQADLVALNKLYSRVGKSHVFELKIDTDGKSETKHAFIWDLKRHPFKPEITSVDFYGVDMNKPIRVEVPVRVVGKSKGVVLGGVLEVFRDTVEVECLPLSVPEAITVDITEMEIGQNLSVEDAPVPDGIKIVFEDSFSILGIAVPSEEAEGGEAAEAATAE